MNTKFDTLFVILLLVALLVTSCDVDRRSGDSGETSESLLTGVFDVPNNILEVEGDHTIEVERVAANENEYRLIRAAENFYPPREEVLESIKTASFKIKTIPTEDVRLWWCSEFDGVRIPYAITKDAIDYYVSVVRALQKGDFSVCNGIHQKASRFRYSVGVTFHEHYEYEDQTFENVHVISMKMLMFTYGGPICAMSFEKERIVILDKDCRIICVYGDGKTPTSVS
ncbi:MAG: hypothetical protein ABIH23_34330 [bacterium]